jgi:serine/threonine protein kinase
MPKRRNIPAFSPPDLKAPRTMMLDHSQHTTLKDWLQTVHQTKKALIVHVNSTLNMKSILAFVYNQYHDFFPEFIKYLFVDIFKLTYQPTSLQVQLDFTFVDNFLKIVMSFRPKAWNLPLYEEDIDIVCSLNVGGSINGCSVEGRLGEGSYGEVFKCTCTRTGVPYAVKVQDSESHDHELKVYKQISCHLNVIDVVNSTYQFQVLGEEFACFFMSFCEQGTLQTHISASGIDTRAIISLFLPPLLDGLNHMHSCGVIHNDIKPTNILVTAEGIAKICDFGLSQELPEGKSVGQCHQEIVTQWYRSPDIWNIDKLRKSTRSSAKYPYSAFSDLWALLLTFLHLCSNAQYNSNPRFQIFREGCYNRHNSQEQINSAIDFIFFGRDAPIGDFFKKYLDLQNYERVTRSLTADPHLQSTIVTDARQDLTSLIGTFSDEMGVCDDPDTKVTPPRPRSTLQFSPIKENSDEEDSDEEDSDEEFDYEDSDEEFDYEDSDEKNSN